MEDEYLSFIRLLNEHQVEYVVLGGYAVIVHGYIRTTGDVDILINTTEQNADKMLMVMLKFGYDVYDFELKDFIQEPGCISLDRYNGKIEILTSTLGVTFEECYANKVVVETDGIPINFISLTDLIKNKQAVGRPKDLEDIRNLPNSKQK
jgi:predicted nucleotidyltransferase